jgi:hypothetical protein
MEKGHLRTNNRQDIIDCLSGHNNINKSIDMPRIKDDAQLTENQGLESCLVDNLQWTWSPWQRETSYHQWEGVATSSLVH